MGKFSIVFSQPLWFLLLIPALALTLIPYFLLSKKHRKTRNRITSMVLHMLVMVCAVSVLAGTRVVYKTPNSENEIILLVDVSHTEEQSKENREKFILNVLEESERKHFKVGVVTFGFDQQYAVPLTHDVNKIYEKYLSAALPDTSATNIAAALDYTKDLFDYPETAKVVLVTDGKETDEQASTVIKKVSLQGIKVDTAYISSSYKGGDVQPIGVSFPDYHVNVGEECTISLTVRSNEQTVAKVEMYDDQDLTVVAGKTEVTLAAGTQEIAFKHIFTKKDLHTITFKVTKKDSLPENNEYHSYFYLEVFDNILILERKEGESAQIDSLLSQKTAYKSTTLNVLTSDKIPATVDALRAYDQVILNNIANKDLPKGFAENLYTYVETYGGGVFTVGGSEDSGTDGNNVAHAYNRDDMYGSVYQQILPVQAINYTPPVGVMVVIDRSGSMADTDLKTGKTKLDWAKDGAISCLSVLSERDYFGVMTLDFTYQTILPMTPRTQESNILAAIDSIQKAEGGTYFPDAVDRAGQALIALKNVDKRHIILVTDGEVSSDQETAYMTAIDKYYKTNGITLSVVAIGMEANSEAATKMQNAVDLGHGRLHTVIDLKELVAEMREDLNAKEIKEVNQEKFLPIISNSLSTLLQGVDRGTEADTKNRMTVALGGFYGVKVRKSADLVLVGEFEVPIYAQWKFGKGMVGSFMCDLSGVWSNEFLADANGQRFLLNVLNNLMPTENIRPKDISAELSEGNYINQLGVYTSLKEGETVQGKIVSMSDSKQTEVSLNQAADAQGRSGEVYVTLALSANNHYSRCSFVIKKSGVYKIVLTKYAADGTVISTLELYKTFSYSAEYNNVQEESEEKLKNKLSALATTGKGAAIDNVDKPWEIFDNFITETERPIDPTAFLITAAIVMFLLDVAVRKFKFKWPNELIRDWKNKRLPK